MNPVIEWIVVGLFCLVWWILLFPILWAASSPVILITAAFSKGAYLESVERMYAGVTRFWAECSPGII